MAKSKLHAYGELRLAGVRSVTAHALVERKKARLGKTNSPKLEAPINRDPLYWAQHLLNCPEANKDKMDKYPVLGIFSSQPETDFENNPRLSREFASNFWAAKRTRSIEAFKTGYALASMLHRICNRHLLHSGLQAAELRRTFQNDYADYNDKVASHLHEMLKRAKDNADILTIVHTAHATENKGIFRNALKKLVTDPAHVKKMREQGTFGALISRYREEPESLIPIVDVLTDLQAHFDKLIDVRLPGTLTKLHQAKDLETGITAVRLAKRLQRHLTVNDIKIGLSVQEELDKLTK